MPCVEVMLTTAAIAAINIKKGASAPFSLWGRRYVKRQKNDMADAEAICEAVTIALPVTAMRGRMTLNSVNLEGFCRAWAIDEARK
jgi:hypothetical protein